MKKVSILSLHLGYGGIEKCVVGLANILCKKYKVELAVTYKLYEKSAFFLDPSIKVIYLTDVKPNHESFRKAIKNKKIFSFFKEAFKAIKVLYYRRKTMIKYIKDTNSDIIISTRDIYNSWLGKYGKKGVLKIGWEHNHFHGDYSYAKRIEKSVKKLDCFVLVSNELKEFYEKRITNKCKCIWITNFLEDIPEKTSSLQEKNLISVGRLSKEKGYFDLLLLFKKLNKQYPDWILHIVGDGDEKEKLEKFVEEESLKDNVIFHGFQKKDYIDSLYHKSSIYLMTSYTESFGIVLIEAMSHGLPCIAYSSAEGARNIIKNNENGFIISDRCEEEMLEKVKLLIENENLRKDLGKKARESIYPYTKDIVSKKWYKLIEERNLDE